MKASTLCLLLALSGAALSAQPPVQPPAAPPPASPSGEPLQVGGNVTRPVKISGQLPAYTTAAREARMQGVVTVEATIDEQGAVADARLLKGLEPGLDKAALAAVSTWKFKPATLDGHPVKVYYTLTVSFQIDDGPSDPLALLGLLSQDRAAQPAAADAQTVQQKEADLKEGRQTFHDLWQWAQGYQGDSRGYILARVGAAAWLTASRDKSLAPAARDHMVELGIEAEELALAARPDLPLALALKGLLLKEKAHHTDDTTAKAALLEEGTRLTQTAYRLHQKGAS